VTCIGATTGKASLSESECVTNQQITSVICNSSVVLARFLLAAVASDAFQRQIWSRTSSTTLPIINKSRFSQLRLNVPSLTEQLAVSDAIERDTSALTRMAEAIDNALFRARALRRSILTSALSGKLVPTTAADAKAKPAASSAVAAVAAL